MSHNHNHESAKRAGEGATPRAGELAAPTPLVKNFAKPHVCIDQWEVVRARPDLERLHGIVRNHPEIPDGEWVYTSGIVGYDPYGAWIETQSTIYILGIPSGMEGKSGAHK